MGLPVTLIDYASRLPLVTMISIGKILIQRSIIAYFCRGVLVLLTHPPSHCPRQ